MSGIDGVVLPALRCRLLTLHLLVLVLVIVLELEINFRITDHFFNITALLLRIVQLIYNVEVLSEDVVLK